MIAFQAIYVGSIPITRSKNMAKKIKKFAFPGIVLIASFYLSIVFTIGAVIGYLGTAFFFRRKIKKTGIVKGIDLPFGKRRIHLHHWILGGLGMFFIFFFSSLSFFWLGLFGGLAFHDLYTDKKWYRIVYKNPASK